MCNRGGRVFSNMKVATTLSIDPDVLAKAKKNIPNISHIVEKYLETILDIKKAKKEADRLQLTEIKLIEVSKELTEMVDINKKLKKETGDLKKKLEKREAQTLKDKSDWIDIGHGGLEK